MNRKKGSSLVTTPVITVCSLMLLIVVFVTMIRFIEPFIWYEKLNIISQKYTYVIEKFGYLTNAEQKELETDLINSGFQIKNVKIVSPSKGMKYGSLFEFILTYDFEQNIISVKSGGLGVQKTNLPLTVRKVGYIKNNIQ